MKSGNSTILDVNIGVKGSFFVMGMTLMGFSIYLALTFSLLVAIPLFYLGFLLMLSIRGFRVDLSKMTIKKYINFFPFKIGRRQSIKQYNRMVLVLSHDTTNGRTGSGAWSQSYSIRTRSFDIYLTNAENEKMDLIAFSEYKPARSFLHSMSKQLNIEKEDLFEESLLVSKVKRYWQQK